MWNTNMSLHFGQLLQTSREERGIPLDDLARWLDVAPDDLRAWEAAPEPALSWGTLRGLSRWLSLDLLAFDPEEDERPAPLPAVWTLLKSAGQFLPARAWPEVIEAAEVAREVVALEAILGLEDRFVALSKRFRPVVVQQDEPWRQGYRLAQAARRALDLGEAPILSMRQVCERAGVLLLEAELPMGVSALCFSDQHHGPTILLNLQGPNENPLVRRVTLAHELCHILYDRNELETLEHFDPYSNEVGPDAKPPVEQRAGAFSVEFLAPEDELARAWHTTRTLAPPEALRAMMERFGVSMTAMRFHLYNHGHPRIKRADPISPSGYHASEACWADDERLEPLDSLRRGRLLGLTLVALERRLITRSRALELLEVDGDAFEQHAPRWREVCVGVAL
jgi:Zn-dependent peptidase ImmA (M78 family)